MLLELFKKVFTLGLKGVRYTKNEAVSTVRALQKEGLLSTMESKKLLKSVAKEARAESRRFQDFFKAEAKREAEKAAKLAKRFSKKARHALSVKRKKTVRKKRV